MASETKLETKWLGYTEPLGLLAALLYTVIGNENGTITPKSVKFYDKFVFPMSNVISPLFKYVGGKNAVLIARKPAK